MDLNVRQIRTEAQRYIERIKFHHENMAVMNIYATLIKCKLQKIKQFERNTLKLGSFYVM